ncbi:MAG: hypothetical protein WC233_01135 [Sphaerochaeta sp.]|jgi:predicted transcriptional regulator of viral defense system|nr:hypothetical protein [Spirochaetales bacterium]
MNRLVRALLEKDTLPLFTIEDIIQAVDGSDNARYGLVKRAMAKGDLVRIKRGLYVLNPRYQKKRVSVFTVSHMIVGQSYISLESALSLHGLIPEGVRTITAVTSKNPQEYHTPMGHLSYERVPQQRLFAGVRRIVGDYGNVWYLATPLKALADYIYTHHGLQWDSMDPLIHSLRIEESDLREITEKDFDELEGNYRNSRVIRFLFGLRDEICDARSHL